jgi:hypothetical protein
MGLQDDRRSGRTDAGRALRSDRVKAGTSSLVASAASKLAHWAGLAPRHGTVETLEKRELLFTVTVTANSEVDAATGLGVERVYFGYVLPYIATDTRIDPSSFQNAQSTTEDFSSDAYGIRGSGLAAIFDQSGIVPVHNISPPSDFRITGEVEGDVNNQNRWLRTALDTANEFFQFEFRSSANTAQRIAVQAFSMQIRPDRTNASDNSGLDLARLRVSLGLNGQTVQTFQGAQLAGIFGGNLVTGTGTLSVQFDDLAQTINGFDSIRIEQLTPFGLSDSPAMEIDDLTFITFPGNFTQLIEPGIFGAVAIISGPIGASATFTDLYGQAMRQTIGLGVPNGAQTPVVDRDDNGIPDFNRGIGSIRLQGVDSNSSFTLWGASITATTTPSPDAEFFESGFELNVSASRSGLFSDFEQYGYGTIYSVTLQGTIEVGGLPEYGGNVVVGSSFVRDFGTGGQGGLDRLLTPIGGLRGQAGGLVADPLERPDLFNFNRADQGIFVGTDARPENIGTINIFGMLHGSSRLTGFVNQFNVGYMVGSVTVKGDVGSANFGSDAGLWAPETDFIIPNRQIDPAYRTFGQAVFERSIGEFAVAGRNAMDVTVVGDLNNPVTRPARDVYVYDEREVVIPRFGQYVDEQFISDALGLRVIGEVLLPAPSDQLYRGGFNGSLGAKPVIFGPDFVRNNTLMSAEFIGSVSSGVRVRGDLSGRNAIQAEDTADVFSFVVDGATDVVVQSISDTAGFGAYFRIMDQDGRTVASPEGPDNREDRSRFNSAEVRFRPSQAGLYYLVVTDPQRNDTGPALSQYSIALSGLATSTFGAYRTGASSGVAHTNPTGNPILSNNITVLSGSLGSVRVGVGFGAVDGSDAEPRQGLNSPFNTDDIASFQAGVFSIAQNLYSIIAGGDIGSPGPGGAFSLIDITVGSGGSGGNLGSLYTGLHPLWGGGPRATQQDATSGEGDVTDTILRVRGSIGVIDIRGGIGMDQENPDPRADTGSGLRIFTGGSTSVSPGSFRGDIGLLRTGFHVVGDRLNIRTSPGSTIGALLFSQDSYTDRDTGRYGVYNGAAGIGLITGAGSDVRFVDFPKIDISASFDDTVPLFGDQTVEVIDDQGGRVSFGFTGAAPGAIIGRIRRVAVDGAQGTAIAQVEIDDLRGITLNIQGLSGNAADVISIGRIIIRQSDATSAIEIGGNSQIDIYRIEAANPIGRLTNSTPGGDIVSADLAGVDTVEIRGSLGRTQMVPFGPRTIAPALGLSGDGTQTEVGDRIGFAVSDGGQNVNATVDNDYNNNVYRPVESDVFAGGDAFLDDIGSPIDDYADGLIVRNSSVTRIAVSGRVGDIILQGNDAATGSLLQLIVNEDRTTTPGGFDGIEGVIYAFNLGDMSIGDGIARADRKPIGTVGLVAANNIGRVGSSISDRPVLVAGTITAGNLAIEFPPPEQVDGVQDISLPGANFTSAFLNIGTLEDFWTSFNYTEERFNNGDYGAINLPNATVFRTTFNANNLGTLNGSGATFDASNIQLTGDAQRINFREYRNSTRLGDSNEFQPSEIVTAGDIASITAEEDISDLLIDTSGDVTGDITARNIIRTTINVDNIARGVRVTGDVRGSSFTMGELRNLTAGGSIVSTALAVSSRLEQITAGDRIFNARFDVTGPAGAIERITALNDISAAFNVTGPITNVTSTRGNIIADISTSGEAGNVANIQAFGDLAITGDISGSLSSAVATNGSLGQFGRTGTLLVRRDIQSISAPKGTLYNDLRAGGAINQVSLGGVTNKPGNDRSGRGSIIAFGRINTISVTGGDFGGDITSFTGGIANVSITNGSFLPGRTISAFAGSIENVTITNGSLLGGIFADIDIRNVSITGGAGGFGDIGISPARSQFITVDARRNQLPAGVGAVDGFEGPLLKAGRDIVSVTTSGSAWESGFVAGRTIQTITIGGVVSNNTNNGTKGSFFAAGDRLNLVTAGSLGDTTVLAGVVSLGADNRPGGTGDNADVIKSGTIGTVTAPGGAYGVTFVAGAETGADGAYGNDITVQGNSGGTDDRLALGTSAIERLNLGTNNNPAQVVGTRLVASRSGQSASVLGDTRFASRTEPTNILGDLLDNGTQPAGTSFTGTRAFTVGSATYTFVFSGPGQAFFDLLAFAGTPTSVGLPDSLLTLRGTTSASSLTVSSSSGAVQNLVIRTNNDGALATLRFNSRVEGNSQVIIDGGVNELRGTSTASLGTVSLGFQPRLRVGGDVNSISFTSLTDTTISARAINTIAITGDVTRSATERSSEIRGLSIGTVSITGNVASTIASQRDIQSVQITGTVTGLRLGARGSINSVSITGALNRAVIAAGYDIQAVNVTGEVFDSSISAGADLGDDVAFDGTGQNSDTVRTGNLQGATFGANFRESDLTAGYLRGPDRFFGTTDDRIAGGRGTIGSVTISGAQVGSSRSSENYTIASNGTIGVVRIGGLVAPQVQGNFELENRLLVPEAIQVTDIVVSTSAGVYTATLTFNQPMDTSSLANSIVVSEVRGQGDIEVRLIQGLDYTLSYTDAGNQLAVLFNRSVTERNLPVTPGRPGPGVYRFSFAQNLTQARLTGVRFDGDNDGLIEPSDNFSGEAVVGDAGDKLIAERILLGDGRFADLYEPTNLNLVLDNNNTPDGLPDTNQVFTVRGFIGDHPDNDATFFRFNGDVDLYRVTLQAGQVIRLGALQGGAQRNNLQLLDSTGTNVGFLADNDTVVTAPVPTADIADFGFDLVYIIKQTGTYFVAVGTTTQITTPATINNPNPSPGEIGDYSFTIEIFDDGDTGFTSNSPSGDGKNLPTPPVGIDFAGTDSILGTADDARDLVVGDFVFNLAAGADGALGTSDDVVTGVDNAGGVIRRVGSTVTTTVDSAIGPVNFAGAPSTIYADADVYHLNGRNTITPGTRMRATLRLNGSGSDLGSLSALGGGTDVRGAVQFALFDTTNSQTTSDADLVFSPTDFLPNAGTPNTVIADNGRTRYGYDAQGDFFIEFIVPPAAGTDTTPGTFALYLQGVINTDYRLELVTNPPAATYDRTEQTTKQNIFLEVNGGSVTWFEAGNQTTTLAPFSTSNLGFNGSAQNGQPVDQYVLARLTTQLNALFQGSGLDVTFSTNPADFEFEPYSTVYISSTVDPITPLFETFGGFNFDRFFGGNNASSAFRPTQPYGASQRSDPLNTNLTDESVVLVPSFALLGYNPGQTDIDRFTESLVGAVSRRAGEMMGARISIANLEGAVPSIYDAFASDSASDVPSTFGRTFTISDTSRQLSTSFDSVNSTDFFLGRQRALSLLSNGVARRG